MVRRKEKNEARSNAIVVLILLLAGSLSLYSQPSYSSSTLISASRAEKYCRTELFFGRSRPDGSTVSDVDWSAFVREVVTPRFPAGFTVLTGLGQWKGREGHVMSEETKVLIILYPIREKKMSRAKIEEIRSFYRRLFGQESVLRIDDSRSKVYF